MDASESQTTPQANVTISVQMKRLPSRTTLFSHNSSCQFHKCSSRPSFVIIEVFSRNITVLWELKTCAALNTRGNAQQGLASIKNNGEKNESGSEEKGFSQ